MARGPGPAIVQLALTPAPGVVERFARALFAGARRRSAAAARWSRTWSFAVGWSSSTGRCSSPTSASSRSGARDCEQIAAVLRGRRGREPARRTRRPLRHGALGVLGACTAARETRFRASRAASSRPARSCELWQLPSVDYATVPVARGALPVGAGPARGPCRRGRRGTLRDELGPVSIHVELRRQNTAVPGTVEQGKTSYLVATVAEDLRRERCAVIVLDPKGDAADAAMSLVPRGRTCTAARLRRPDMRLQPARVDAPADVIADYVVAALKNLFTTPTSAPRRTATCATR